MMKKDQGFEKPEMRAKSKCNDMNHGDGVPL